MPTKSRILNFLIFGGRGLEFHFRPWPLGLGFYFRYRNQHINRNRISSFGLGWSCSFGMPFKRHRIPVQWFRRPKEDGSAIPWSCWLQEVLRGLGVSACNPFRQECTIDFSCCNWHADTSEFSGLLHGLAEHRHAQLHEHQVDVISSSILQGKSIYISASSGKASCKVCGKSDDLRCGVCFDCVERVEILDSDIEGLQYFREINNPDNAWYS